ncbi:PDZ domain-containing protein [Tautonia rosea]|uniref:PDZ domain-containing protein n=1 Tax=Tautonia rosea TaxID=2728037 RepID=UPI0014751880|nr:PDZ domain-containing protein [Tautonia rosea]
MVVNRLRTPTLALGLCLTPMGMIQAQNTVDPDQDQTHPAQIYVFQRPNASPEQQERVNEALRQLESMQRHFPGQASELPFEQFRGMRLLLDEEEAYGSLGLRLRPVPEVLRSHLELPEQGGLVVDAVAEGSPAAGIIERNDIVLKLGEITVKSDSDMEEALSELEGDEITVTLMREGTQQTVTLTRTSETPVPADRTYRMGVVINEPDDAVRAQLGLPEGTGVIVMEVAPNSAAEKAGLKANDVLVELDGESVVGATELAELVQKSKGEAISLNLVRDGERITIEVTPDSVPVTDGQPTGPESRGLRAPRGAEGMRFFGPGVMIDPETGTLRPGPRVPGAPGAPRQPFQLREFPGAPRNLELEQQLEDLKEQLKSLREEVEALKDDLEARPGRRGRGGV